MTTQTQITTFAVVRDDGEFMEGGWLNEDEAHTRAAAMRQPRRASVLIHRGATKSPFTISRTLASRANTSATAARARGSM